MLDKFLVKDIFVQTASDVKKVGHTTEKGIDRVEYIMWGGFILILGISLLLTLTGVVK